MHLTKICRGNCPIAAETKLYLSSVDAVNLFDVVAPCLRIHRSTTETYSARFFIYLIGVLGLRFRVRVLVVVRVWVRVTVGARVMVGVGLVRG